VADDPKSKTLEDQRFLLELTDPLGNIVYLFEPRWNAKIVLDHPVTLEDVRATISDPDVIYEFGGDRRYYRRLGRSGYMFSVTKLYRGRHNSVVTTYPLTHIQEWGGAKLVYVSRRR